MADKKRVEGEVPEEEEEEEMPEGETPEGEEQEPEPEPEPEPESGDGDARAELARVRVALKKANAEAAKRRKELERFQQEEKKRQDAELSDLEKAQKLSEEWKSKFDELSADLDGMRMRQAFYDATAAAKVVFVNDAAWQDAYDLSDLSGVEVDEDGSVSGMDEVIKALQKTRPHLFGTAGAPDINAGEGGKPKGKAGADDEAIRRRYGI